jgi:hypothetical protein
MAVPVGVLLPLRLETRFYGRRLRLRVIPDEPWLDRHDPLPSAAELDALDRYLTAAGGGPPATPAGRAAWEVFGRQVGAGRAAWLLRSFPAGGPDADGRWHATRPGTLREEPRFTELAGLPERLEVWLARGGGPPKLAETLAVDPARLRMDPPDPADPADRRWWESWEEARQAGLAAEIDLGAVNDDVDALYVVGLGTAVPANLLAAHRDAGRIGLVAYGTPTNTVDGRAAADLAGDPNGWVGLLTRPATPVEEAVSAALTGDPHLLGAVPGDPPPQDEWARLLVAGLWPALWGHTLADILGLGPDAEELAGWASDNLHPAGPYPAVRVGGQPYGLLPATELAAWQPAPGDPPLEAGLPPALAAARDKWAADAETGRGTVEGAAAERLLDLVGQPAAAPGYATRLLDPLELWLAALHATGTPITWPELLDRWGQAFPLAGVLGLDPLRRYGARGTGRRVRLPLVVPERLPASVPVGEVLRNLLQFTEQNPSGLVNLRTLTQELLWGGSLWLVLAARALQVAVAGVGRDNLGVATPDLEPVAADPATQTRLAEQVQAVRPVHLTGPTQAAQAYRRVAGALKVVATIPVEELERLLPATIDCAGQRVDAWCMGPPRRRLAGLLAGAPTGADHLLGAYGWVDRPRPGKPGPTGGGLLHAPSAGQAVTSALLRDRAVRDPEPGRWHMDITSTAARDAAALGAAVNFGAHLAEALGAEVERAVGDPAAIRRLRDDFPIRTEHAGRRVCDGPAVLGADPATLGLGAAVLERLERLRAAVDAYGDLLVAEAVHDVVQGRPEAAGAAMDAAAGVARPPALDVLRTAREGRAAETSCAVVLEDVAAPALPSDPDARAEADPAAVADPAAAAFVATRTGAATAWSWNATPAGGGATVTVTLDELGLSPAAALALPLADLERLVTAEALAGSGAESVELTGRDGAARYDRAVRLVALLGQAPANPVDLTDGTSAGGQPAAEVELRGRLAALRSVAAALADRLDAAATTGERTEALALAGAWGLAPPPPAGDGGADPLPGQVTRARDQLRRRLAATPDAAATDDLDHLELARAIARLASATGQVAVLGRARRDALPPLQQAAGLDQAWLRVVAAVRAPLARLEVAQLAAGTPAGIGAPLVAWANRATDPWQEDASDPRRLVAAYAPGGLDLAAGPAGRRLAVGLLDRFTETVPSQAHTTTAAFGFDAPGSRAPQAILLAVPPDLNQPLDTAGILRIVAETRALARARMATHADLNGTDGFTPLPLVPATGVSATPLPSP